MLRILCIITWTFILQSSIEDVDAFALGQIEGCFHNGSHYADESLVPTVEPCLSCRCTNKTLICNLRVCPEMPLPPPRGCVLVHKKNNCCSYISCSKFHVPYDGPNRRIITYLDQFDRDSIDRVVSENVLQRRSDDGDFEGSGEICVYNGTVYKSGSAMSSSNLCTYCYCIGGVQKCVKPKCMLSMAGCKPIYVDSTCCPVRYDCTSKSAGVFKSQNYVRRSDNKHYLRMISRLQRTRGCLTDSYFYPEGQKMPSDPSQPCDICFCIRGSRQCAPKKCSPPLRNCLPVVPKGQCCPSSYDCNNPKELSRTPQSQARQFDLFSLFFGDAENTTTSTTAPVGDVAVKPTTEKSFFDAIREGLAFLDSEPSAENTSEILKEDDLNLKQSTGLSSSTTVPPDDESSFSFLDLILGQTSQQPEKTNFTDYDDDSNSTTLEPETEEDSNADGENDDFSLLDLFLGKEVPSTTAQDKSLSDETTELSTPGSDEDDDFKEYLNVDDESLTTENNLGDSTEITTNFPEITETSETPETPASEAVIESKEITTVESSTILSSNQDVTSQTEIQTEGYEKEANTETTNGGNSSLSDIDLDVTGSDIYEVTTDYKIPLVAESLTLENKTHSVLNESKIMEETEYSNATKSDPHKEEKLEILKIPTILNKTENKEDSNNKLETVENSNETNIEVEKIKLENVTKLQSNGSESLPNKETLNSEEDANGDFISALINGLSSMFEKDGNTTLNTALHPLNKSELSNKTKETKPKPPEVLLEKINLTRIHTKINAATESHHVQVLASSTTKTPKYPPTSITSEASILNHTKPDLVALTHQITEKPLIIKTNPTILEADYNFDYNEPTLPPSLPNLKIIPFLPADAVKSDRKQIVYDYYKVSPTAYPSITEKHDTWDLGPAPKNSNSKIDFDAYEQTGYPSITEVHDNPTSYPEKYIPLNANYKKYGYNEYDYSEFAVHDKYDLGTSKHDKYIDDIKYIQNKYDPALTNFDGSKISFVTPGYEKFATIFTENSNYGPPVFGPTEGQQFDYEHSINKFSPPTKTEGGFVPKEPIKDHFYYDNLYTTKYVVDITTALPLSTASTGNITVNGTTTEDPFKDVIRTEPPPELHLLIEDKEKLLANGKAPQIIYEASIENIDPAFEKEIISITTDSSYNYTSEKNLENEISIGNTDKIYSLNNETLSTINNVEIITISPTQNFSKIEENFVAEPEKNSSVLLINHQIDPSLLGEGFDKDSEEDLEYSDGLDRVLSLLFQEETENSTIPVFKTLPPKEVFEQTTLNTTTEKLHTTENPEVIFQTPSKNQDAADLSILKHALLSTFKLSEPVKYKQQPKVEDRPSEIPESINAFFSEPFNKLPFINPSYPVKPHDGSKIHENFHYNPLNSDLDLKLPDSNSNLGPESYHILPNDSIISQTDPYVINPVDIDKLKQHQSEGNAEIFTKPETTNSIKDPAGILKLSGCNIYGRMYRVGRIISELSGPCLECKCTEVGVNCTPLDC